MSESILADRSAFWLGRRCPKAIPAEVLRLDSAHPWVLSEDLEQIRLRVLGLAGSLRGGGWRNKGMNLHESAPWCDGCSESAGNGLPLSEGSRGRCTLRDRQRRRFGYGADFEVDPGADALVSYSEFLASAVEDYDVFHFYFRSFFFFEPANNAFPSGLDLLMLRAAGKTVVMHYRGSEVREAERFREFSPYNYVDENPSGIFTKFREPSLSSRIDYVRSVANVVLVPDEELKVMFLESHREAGDRSRMNFSVPPDPENEVPLVIRAESANSQGTDYVLEAVEQLRADGVRLIFDLSKTSPIKSEAALSRGRHHHRPASHRLVRRVRA